MKHLLLAMISFKKGRCLKIHDFERSLAKLKGPGDNAFIWLCSARPHVS